MNKREYEGFRYNIRLLIHHPDIDPTLINNTLGISADRMSKIGDIKKAPNGNLIGGTYTRSMWTKSYNIENIRYFTKHISDILTVLEVHKDFVIKLSESGGTIIITLDLFGQFNIGDVLSWKEMSRLVELRIDLGVEVFPEL